MPAPRLTRTLVPFLVLVLSVTCLYAQEVEDVAVEAPPEFPSLGWIAVPQDAGELVAAVPAEATGRPVARLIARWEEIERERGVYDWSRLQPAVSRFHGAGIGVTLCLTGSNRLYLENGAVPVPFVPGAVDAWSAFARSAVRTLGDRIEVLEIWDGPADPGPGGEPAFAPEVYAFLLKSSTLAARAEAKANGTRIRVSQGALDARHGQWQRTLWEADVAPYVDVLPLRFRESSSPDSLGQALDRILLEALQYPPAPAMRVYLEPDAAEPWNPLGPAVRALASSVEAVLVPTGRDGGEREVRAAWVAGMQQVFASGFAPAPAGEVTFRDGGGSLVEGVSVPGRFFSEKDFTALLVYDASEVEGRLEKVHAVIPSTFVRNASTIDPVAGRTLRTAARNVEGNPKVRSLRLPVAPYPVALVYQAGVVTPGFEVQEEELDIRRTRGLTAEEIIARYREIQEVQDDTLERWIADARIEFHFKFAQAGSTLDVGIDSVYFWEKGSEIEWEQTAYYLNGNPVRWKNIPELPLIQPEKVVTLPLDLTLDKTYRYRLTGEDRVQDRGAYVLAFEPEEDTDGTLYYGRVWIDRDTFERLKMSVVQTNLEAPVLSNEEVDRFRTQEGPGGETYRLLDRIEGQQLWTAGGRNLVVRREVSFLSYDINPSSEEFRSRRDRAYASDHQMLRDTGEGFRYLERQDDGSRTVKESVDTSQLFAAAGAFKDSSSDGVTPLAGVNYFDYDVAGRNIQMNVLFGGVVGLFNATKPDLFGRKLDASVDAAGVAIKFDDKVFSGTRELGAERIRSRGQVVSLRLGVPVGDFFKVTLVGGLTFRQFDVDSDVEELYQQIRDGVVPLPASTRGLTDPEFRLPEDHTVVRGEIQAEYNRRGYTITASASKSRRSDWSAWGLFDRDLDSFVTFDPDAGETGEYVPFEGEPVLDSFSKWGMSAFKEWYLPKFQKVRGEINYLDGSDLDRFSRYEFSLFGDDRLSGFAGSGVRFDSGTVLRGGYSFNLFEVIRLDAILENARVETEGSLVGSQSFTGVGLSGNVIGPWKTVISLSYGRALASDIPELKGEQEFLLFVFKLF